MKFTLPSGKSCFYQWDSGMYLIPESMPSDAEYYIHWYGETTGEDNRLNVDSDGNILIPDIVFQEAGRITLTCRYVSDDLEYSAYIQRFDVKPKCKPEGYIANDTDFADYIAKVKKYIDEHGGGGGSIGTPTVDEDGNLTFSGTVTPTIDDDGNLTFS